MAMELIEAAVDGSLERVKAALAVGASVDGEDPGGQTALFWAAMGGHGDMLRVLLQAGAVVEKRNPGGQTSLMGAAMRGQKACAEALLAAGAGINGADSRGLTAWAWAALHEKPELCDFLVAAGADTLVHHARCPDAQSLPIVDLERLARCDGTGPDLWLGCLGLVFNMSSGRSFYGPGGAYAAFAGRDATIAFARHVVAVPDGPPPSAADILALPTKERIAAEGWSQKFKDKYPIVGRLPSLAPTEEETTGDIPWGSKL